eukprot:TRINITY_DN25606_c1_g1_i1.p1 TRINITY_DN25606_c1_g1~~TRINITY_DN25606_c1_g1_i1.p1  ORF type:complete len:696 (+),score=186.40 TRINITY_DN25606_c1_g1_i1:65-2152(+)
MGCGASKPVPVPAAPPDKSTSNGQSKEAPAVEQKAGNTAGFVSVAPGQASAPLNGTPAGRAADTPVFPGRERHMPLPAMREVDQDGRVFYMSAFPHLGEYRGLTLACRNQEGEVWARQLSDEETKELREDKAKTLGWPSFWKALNSAFTKGEPPRAVADFGSRKRLDIPLKSSKEPQVTMVPVTLDPLGASPSATYTHYVSPFLVMYSRRKARKLQGEEGVKVTPESEHEARESRINLDNATRCRHEMTVAGRLPLVEPLRNEAQEAQKEQQEVASELDRVNRAVRRLRQGSRQTHHLDGIYREGGARSFQHTRWSAPHEPHALEACDLTLRLTADRLAGGDPAALLTPPTDPELQKLLETVPGEKARAVMEHLQHLDQWHYNCFKLEKATDGTALVHTAWALHHKYGHIQRFGMDPQVVKAFWTEVSRGYHPNAYHNATHAADVLQITHYILGPGNMSKVVNLTKEDELAALLAAGIHDYDHPGLNNNFHSRTSAYLAILYNDRSVLENHHCSCIFELMQLPKYDILASLDEDQRKDVRETVVDMLLGTDMTNHAKIFSAFRRRLSDTAEWNQRREDARGALVMAIKMADISNCGRPTDIYLRWAENIAAEFYHQGDAELAMELGVSPFMDRKKHVPDFSRGQISFMNYIVIPLFEACTQLLPNLEFTVGLCHKNREHWQHSLKEPIPNPRPAS